MFNEITRIDLNLLSTGLALLTIILSVVIQVFSGNYLVGDSKRVAFLTKLNCLTFSMLLLIITDNIWTFLFSWILSNVLLVSLMIHKSNWKQAVKSGHIAFTYMFFGFMALSIGIFIIEFKLGLSLFSQLKLANLSQDLIIVGNSVPLIWFIGFALLIPAMIQSAQIPFSKWFLSSLNSPTPVSALMHAGLINGGGILLIKFFPLIVSSQVLMNLIFIIGSITALICSASMLVQTKIKNKLACSTAGQMGFMFMEIGAGLLHLAVLHLIMHGLYKSYLFLNSSSVVFEKNKVKISTTNLVSDFVISVFAALIISLVFSNLAGIKISLASTETLMLVFTFIAIAQFIFSAIKSNHSFSFRCIVFGITSVISFAFGLLLGIFHQRVESVWLNLDVELSWIHYSIVLLMGLLWLVINLQFPFKFEENSNLNKRLYMLLVNFARPFGSTVTTQRKDYAY